MNQQSLVVFRNVGQFYFPQTRVECHYSLPAEHRWSSGDWIGIFQLGWSSVKQYHTYTWALVPEGYAEGTAVDHCAVFHAFYLPHASAVEYQFVYVSKLGKVCARSRAFTFCAPKPLEELETLKEEQDGEDGGEEELLLVVPRAQLLQSRLDESLKKQADLQRALDRAKQEAESEKNLTKKARSEWENERDTMKGEITELRDNLRHTCELLKRLEGKNKDVEFTQENLSSELNKLEADKSEKKQHIRDLEEEIKAVSDREKQANTELERLKERVKKMTSQMKHDEEKRKSLQVEIEASAAEVRGLQGHLEASEHGAEGLRRELRELGARQNQTHAELHQARLQVAQLTLQLSELDLLLREERASSALEREAYRHAAEVDKKKMQEVNDELKRKEEWLQEERTERDNLEAELGRQKELLSDAKSELQELKSRLRKAQKEREDEQLHKQYLESFIHQLEQKVGPQPNTNLAAGVNPEDASSAAPRSAVDLDGALETLAEPCGGDWGASDSQMLLSKTQTALGKQLILPDLVDPVLSELADSPMW